MPTPIERQSLNTTLEDRYAKQHIGGAYDARTAGDATVDFMGNEFAKGFTKGGQNTGLPLKDSALLKGWSGDKYKP